MQSSILRTTFFTWFTATTLALGAETTKEPAREPEQPAVESFEIKPQPLAIKPGDPMSARALVTNPAVLPGALTWTIETRQHRGALVCMAVSPDGKQLATGGVDGAIRIWNLADGQLLRVLVGHNSYVHSLSWSPDGKTLASGGGWDATIRLWNATSGMPLRVFKSPKGYVGRVAWASNGAKLLATGDHSGWLWLWDVRANSEKVLLEVGQDVLSVDWSADSQHFAVTITAGTVTIVDSANIKNNQFVDDPATVHYCVRWSPDGKKLFVGSAAQSIIYEMPGGETLQTLKTMGYIAAWSPDGKQICTANTGGAATLWEVETGKLLKTFVSAGTEFIWHKAVQSSSGGSASSDTGVLLARGVSGVTAWRPSAAAELFYHSLARILPPTWTPGKPIVRGVGTNTLSLWDSTTAKRIAVLEGHTAIVSAISWTRDGKTLASASYDGTVRLWDGATGKLLQTLKEHNKPVYCLAWSLDGKTLASGGADFMVRLWSLSGKPLGTLEGHKGNVTALTWSPRGNLLASGSYDTKVRLWNPDKQQMQLEINAGQPVLSLAFNGDGSVLAGGVATLSLRFWQPGNGQLLTKDDARYNTAPRGVTSMSWSPDGSALLLASNHNHGMWLWAWREPKMVHGVSLLAASSYVVFSTGAQMMVAGCHDGMTRFLDSATAGIRGVILDEGDHLVLISASGNFRLDKAFEPEFLFILQTEKEQEMVSVADFAERYHWKNVPTAVKFSGK